MGVEPVASSRCWQPGALFTAVSLAVLPLRTGPTFLMQVKGKFRFVA